MTQWFLVTREIGSRSATPAAGDETSRFQTGQFSERYIVTRNLKHEICSRRRLQQSSFFVFFFFSFLISNKSLKLGRNAHVQCGWDDPLVTAAGLLDPADVIGHVPRVHLSRTSFIALIAR